MATVNADDMDSTEPICLSSVGTVLGMQGAINQKNWELTVMILYRTHPHIWITFSANVVVLGIHRHTT